MTRRFIDSLALLAFGLVAGYFIAPHRNWEAHWTPDLGAPGTEVYLGHFESAELCAETAKSLLRVEHKGFVNCGFKCSGEKGIEGRECKENIKHAAE